MFTSHRCSYDETHFVLFSSQLSSAISGEISDTHIDVQGDEAVLDMSQWMSRAALESVGQGILGYSFDSLNSPSTNKYTRAVRELMFVISSLLVSFCRLKYSYCIW